VPRIPLIEELTAEPIPPGSNVLVEFDASSHWFEASTTIAIGWLKGEGEIGYTLATQPPDSLRSQIKRLGLDVQEFEANGKLEIWDWYSATLGQKSKEKFEQPSLKVADLSIEMSQGLKEIVSVGTIPEYLRILDNCSVLARFNDNENTWVEFLLTRIIPRAFYLRSTLIIGIMRGIHSDRVYRLLEGAVEGVVDFKLDESGQETRNIIRVRRMRNIGFDSRWHKLKVGKSFEVTLEK
jgi:KaiC/GvpD/RAD55 family RecA-like ATPase